MNLIKIGRETYEIKKGDYILDNGACFQFCSGDGRNLKQKGWYAYNNLKIPQSVLKKINLDELTKKTINNPGMGFPMIKYYF